MNCYGSYGRRRKSDCTHCSELRWCREASDVELLRDHMVSFAEESSGNCTVSSASCL